MILNSLNLALKEVWKNKITLLLLIVQIVFSSFIFTALIGKVQDVVNRSQILNTVSDKNAVYYSDYMYNIDDSNDEQVDITSILKNEAGINSSVGECYDMQSLFTKKQEEYSNSESDNSFFILGYNDTLIDIADINLKTGVWFDECSETKYVPLVTVGDKYKLGEIIDFYNDNSDKLEKQGRVIGIIDKSEYIYNLSQAGDVSLENIACVPNSDGIILPAVSKKYNSFDNDISLDNLQSLGHLLITDDVVDTEKIKSVIGSYVYVISLQEMKDDYSYNLTYSFTINGVLLLVFTLITFIGIGGLNAIYNLNNEKRYTIYFMLGLTQKGCAIIESVRSFCIIFIGFLISVILFNIPDIHTMFVSNGITVNWLTFVFIFCYLAVIYLCTSVPYIVKLGTKRIIENYKERA